MEVSMSAKRKLAAVVGAVSFIYLFVPEPTDLIPIVGWMDEGMAAALLLWALKTLGVTPGALLGSWSSRGSLAKRSSDVVIDS
jgi:hypothetical protein